MSKKSDPRIFIMLTAVALLGGGFVTYSQYQELSDTQGKIAALRLEAKDEKSVQKELDDSEAKLADLRDKLNHLEAGIPDVAFVPTMMKELETTGKANGIEVTGVRPLPPKASGDKKDAKEERKKPYDEVEIEMKGRGHYASVQSFIKALNSFPKVVSARMISLEPKRDTMKPTGAAPLDITIQIRAYVFKEAKDNKDKDSKSLASNLGPDQGGA